jgi:hypothetical protein
VPYPGSTRSTLIIFHPHTYTESGKPPPARHGPLIELREEILGAQCPTPRIHARPRRSRSRKRGAKNLLRPRQPLPLPPAWFAPAPAAAVPGPCTLRQPATPVLRPMSALDCARRSERRRRQTPGGTACAYSRAAEAPGQRFRRKFKGPPPRRSTQPSEPGKPKSDACPLRERNRSSAGL